MHVLDWFSSKRVAILIVGLFSVGLFSWPAQAQSSLADHPRVAETLHLFDAWLEAELAFKRIPGFSVGVVHDQEMVWAKGYGMAHVEQGVPATPQTMYSICSISKLFTATAVMQLRDAGHLRLDDPVGTHLDWFNIEDTYPEAGPVTVEGLLTHSSGLPRESAFSYWTGPDFPFPTHDEIVGRLGDQEMLYPPLTYFQYSNLGLTLAGELVEAKSDGDFERYIQQHILQPLGMKHTNTDHKDKYRGKQLATGYSTILRSGEREVVNPYQVRGVAPAAGFTSTVEDLGRFASWQFRALAGEDDALLDRNTLREMHRVHWMEPDGWTTWGLGYSIWRENDKSFVGHGGSCPGYRSQLLIRPQDEIATMFMTNGQGIDASHYARRLYDALAPALKAAKENPDAEPEAGNKALEPFTGLYQRPGWGGESFVFTWKGKLAMISLPNSTPTRNMTTLKHIEGNVFQRERSNGDLGERFEFRVNAEGQMEMWRNNQYSVRVVDN